MRSDHGALRWLLNFKNPEGQIARWIEILSTYDMEIQHRQGIMHSNADSLSRRPCMNVECSYCDKVDRKNSNSQEIGIQTDIKVCDSSVSLLEITLTDDANASPCKIPYNDMALCRRIISVQEMSEMQSGDSALKHVMTWKLSGIKPEWKDISSESVEVKHHWARLDAIELKDNVLYRKWESECGKEVVDYSA